MLAVPSAPPQGTISEYVGRVSGVSRTEVAGPPDHTYAKTSVWRPRNYLAKPCRHLYNAVGSPRGGGSGGDLIDVETVDEEPLVPSFPREPFPPEPEPVPADDWAERISKANWSPLQVRILPKALRIVEDVRLHRLACMGRPNERFHLEDALNCSGSKLSCLLSSVGWDKSVTQWLHALLMKHLSPVEKDDYLLVLGLVKRKAASLVDRMVAPVHFGRSSAAKDRPMECVIPLRKRLDDRVAEILLEERFAKLPRDPVFFLIPNSPECARTDRFRAFVNQLCQMAQVQTVSYPPRTKATVQQGLDQMVAETRSRLAETRLSSAGRPVVLIGWNVGAAIASLLAQLEPIHAVVCLGYPFKTVDGDRRQSNLSTAEISCPVLFLSGARSTLASLEDMEELRSQMRAANQLVVVGGCNDQLIMSHKERAEFCVTQAMVDRSLLVEVYNFVGELLTQPPPPPPPQKPPVPPVPPRLPVPPSYRKRFKEHVPCKPTATLTVNGKRISNSPPKRKPRATTPAQKLIVINSAKYATSMLPHHNYASRLQPLMLAGPQGYQRNGPPK